MAEQKKVEFWGVVELFGHNQVAGLVSEATLGGCSFVRVDVPEAEGRQAFTKYYGQGAIYAMHPCSEELARAAAAELHGRGAPMPVYIPDLEEAHRVIREANRLRQGHALQLAAAPEAADEELPF